MDKKTVLVLVAGVVIGVVAKDHLRKLPLLNKLP